MPETEYFYVSENVLTPGTALQTWNPDPDLVAFLRKVAGRGLEHLCTALQTDMELSKRFGVAGPIMKTAFQELMLETERAEKFPTRPPRLGSVMVFRTTEAAQAFNRNYRSDRGLIHACRIAEGTGFDTWMEWTSGGSLGAESCEQIVMQKRARAAAYWRPDTPQNPQYAETLVAGRVLVIETVGGPGN